MDGEVTTEAPKKKRKILQPTIIKNALAELLAYNMRKLKKEGKDPMSVPEVAAAHTALNPAKGKKGDVVSLLADLKKEIEDPSERAPDLLKRVEAMMAKLSRPAPAVEVRADTVTAA